jgi:Fe-S cluster assembly scaffold protein SufB
MQSFDIKGNFSIARVLHSSEEFFFDVAEGACLDAKFSVAADGDDDISVSVSACHSGPASSSKISLAGAADGRSRISFKTSLSVAEGADGVKADQKSRIILLAPSARGKIEPFQDIHSPFAAATHSAAIYQPGEDDLFFLALRGIGAEDAKKLLTNALLAI